MGRVQSSGQQIDVVKLPHGWSVSGEIDALTSGPLADALEDLPDVADGPIELDLAGVTFIDSSGLRVLLRVADRVAAVGGTVVVRNPSKAVSRLVAITKLESTFGLDMIGSDTPAD